MSRIGMRNRRRLIRGLGVLILGGASLLGWSFHRETGRVRPLRQGLAAYEARDWAAAEQAARDRLRTHRDDAEALRLLSRAWFRQDRNQPALSIQSRLPDRLLSAEDYFLRGQAAVRLGRKEYGILAWRQALGKNNDHAETLLALEQTFFRLDLLNEAARAAKRLAAQPGWETRAHLLLARIHAAQSDPASAAEALRRALKRPDQWNGNDHPESVAKQLAGFLLSTGRAAEARDALREFAVPTDDPEVSWLLSRCDLQQGVAIVAEVAAPARSYRDEHPMEPEPAPYVGEASCSRCHSTNYQAQHHSRHARTFFPSKRFPSIPLPDRPVVDPDDPDVTHRFDRDGDQITVETRVEDRVLQTIVDYAFGSGDRGMTLVGHDPEGHPFEFRLSRYADPVGWDVTSGQPRDTGQAALYQGMRITADAVRRCLACHTTNPHAITTGSGPESSDAAIGCERCHGPGSLHIKAVEAHADDLAIARPTLADARDIVALCSQCHSPRDPELPMSPGAVESVRFQGATFTWSRCYTESGNAFHCVDCHNPHRDVETSTSRYENQCRVCHAPTRSGTHRVDGDTRRPGRSRAVAASTSTCPVQPESGCIDCHMPRVTIPMTHATFTDHFIRVHRDVAPGPSESQGATP